MSKMKTIATLGLQTATLLSLGTLASAAELPVAGGLLGDPVLLSPACSLAEITSDGLSIRLKVDTAGAADALVGTECSLQVAVNVPKGMRVGIPLAQSMTHYALSEMSMSQANASVSLDGQELLGVGSDYSEENGDHSEHSKKTAWTACGQDAILSMSALVRIQTGPSDDKSEMSLELSTGGLVWEKCAK
jgi:hypothetical protein